VIGVIKQKLYKRINIPKFQGVYYRESSKRRHLGKPDRCFDICYRDLRGKLIWEKVGWAGEGYTAVTASQIRSEKLRSIRHGEILPKKKPEEVTLGEVWTRYDEWIETAIVGKYNERGYYKKHIEPVFSNTPLSKIGVSDLERFKTKLSNNNLAPATVKHILVIVRQLINKAILWGLWTGENPVSKVKLPKLNNKRERFLSYDEAFILLKELEKVSPQLKDIALLSLYTGMRANEIFLLKWSHLDMENNLIHIADPKNVHARKVFMTQTIKDLFKNIERRDPEDYIFISRTGGKIDKISHAYDRTVCRLGNSCDFWKSEFASPLSPDLLRSAIINDHPEIFCGENKDSLMWLNELLEMQSLYEVLTSNRDCSAFNKDLKELIALVKNNGQTFFKKMNVTEKNTLKRLNRLLLETIYPNESPKLTYRFNNGIRDPRQKITFHTLRHTFASWLALQGTPILTIKELLGHQTLVMTERYSHLSPDQKKDAVNGIEAMFEKNMAI